MSALYVLHWIFLYWSGLPAAAVGIVGSGTDPTSLLILFLLLRLLIFSVFTCADFMVKQSSYNGSALHGPHPLSLIIDIIIILLLLLLLLLFIIFIYYFYLILFFSPQAQSRGQKIL